MLPTVRRHHLEFCGLFRRESSFAAPAYLSLDRPRLLSSGGCPQPTNLRKLGPPHRLRMDDGI